MIDSENNSKQEENKSINVPVIEKTDKRSIESQYSHSLCSSGEDKVSLENLNKKMDFHERAKNKR